MQIDTQHVFWVASDFKKGHVVRSTATDTFGRLFLRVELTTHSMRYSHRIGRWVVGGSNMPPFPSPHTLTFYRFELRRRQIAQNIAKNPKFEFGVYVGGTTLFKLARVNT